MKKILCLLCALALAISLLAACDKNDLQPDINGAVTRSPGDGLQQQDFEFNTIWPENEFTKLLPPPTFETALDEPGEMELAIICAANVDQCKDYVESLKKAGYTENENTIDESAFGMIAYIYTASNKEGYTVEVNYSNTLGSITTLTIKKPS